MNSNAKRLLITLAPPIAAAILFIFKKYILIAADFLPPCRFHALTGLLCPGCGNTRAAKEMLSLHFAAAFRYNITVPLLSAAAVLLYLQYVISAWVKPVRLFPRNLVFFCVLGALFAAYCIARNFVNFMP